MDPASASIDQRAPRPNPHASDHGWRWLRAACCPPHPHFQGGSHRHEHCRDHLRSSLVEVLKRQQTTPWLSVAIVSHRDDARRAKPDATLAILPCGARATEYGSIIEPTNYLSRVVGQLQKLITSLSVVQGDAEFMFLRVQTCIDSLVTCGK